MFLIFLLTNSTAIEYNFIKIKSCCENRADLSLSTSEPVCMSFREIAYRLILFGKTSKPLLLKRRALKKRQRDLLNFTSFYLRLSITSSLVGTDGAAPGLDTAIEEALADIRRISGTGISSISPAMK